MMPSGPNTEQIQYWAEAAGPRWVAAYSLLDAQIETLGRAAMDALAVATGDTVIDVGCGCGQTSLQLAERVGAGGRVIGADVSPPMLALARERAGAAGLEHVEFIEADAQVHSFDAGAADAVFSRFGVMFFADPVAAFANLLAALRPGGRVGFVCWQPLQRNPWMLVPVMAAAQHVALPPPPAPGAPGPFSLGEATHLRGVLERAGLRDLGVESLEEMLSVGGAPDLETAVDFIMQVGGPLATALREADAATVERVRAAVRDALAPYAGPDGVRMPGAAWLVTARRA